MAGKFRLSDRFYYAWDIFTKLLAEATADVVHFFERLLASVVARIFLTISVFFVNPFTETKLTFQRALWGIPRVFVGVVLLTLLCSAALVTFLVGGTLAGIFGFRNIVDYSLKEQVAAWLPMILLGFILPFLISEYWIFKVSMVLCFTTILVGFNFLYGQCGILSLGHAGFVMLGAFLTAMLYGGTFGFKVPFLAAVFLAGGGSFVVGLALGLPSLRVKDYYLVIVTLAFMIAIPQIMSSTYLAPYSGVNTGGLSVDQVPVPEFLSRISQSTWDYFLVVGVTGVLLVFAYNVMYFSQVGRAFRTIKCDVEVSTVIGIDVVKYKLLAFAMSAGYAAVAGGLIMYLNRFISTDSYTVHDSIDYIVAAVVGGPTSILGCVTGGLFLTYEKDLAAAMGHFILGGNALTRMFYGIIMIFIVFVAPRGIAGELSRKLKTKYMPRPSRGKYYVSPPPDYDFLNMKGSPIKDDERPQK